MLGANYIDVLAKYSAASLLAPGNLVRASERHEITWQLVGQKDGHRQFRATPAFRQIEKICDIDFVTFEDAGIKNGKVPHGFDNNKYTFLSMLQNCSMRRAIGHDVIMFNYADCIWADGSFSYSLDLMEDDDTDALLSFGAPVDEAAGKKALEIFRIRSKAGEPIEINSRDASRLIAKNLHREARLRFWEAEDFTNTPSYLLWEVPGQGLIVRCCHQTIIALRVKPDDEVYSRGITSGSLDGNYSATVTEKWPYRVVRSSDQVALFSLFDTDGNSKSPPDVTREHALKRLLLNVAPSQRRLLFQPILLKYDDTDARIWSERLEVSRTVIDKFLVGEIEGALRPNQQRVGDTNRFIGKTAGYLSFYGCRLIEAVAHSVFAGVIKTILGPHGCRAMRKFLGCLLNYSIISIQTETKLESGGAMTRFIKYLRLLFGLKRTTT